MSSPNGCRLQRHAYSRAKEHAKARSAAITLAGQDIAPLPKVADAARRARADRDGLRKTKSRRDAKKVV
jgi:hypothetical protein